VVERAGGPPGVTAEPPQRRRQPSEAQRQQPEALDGARAAARVLGEELARDGTIGDPDDLCYLTVDEIFGCLPARPPARR